MAQPRGNFSPAGDRELERTLELDPANRDALFRLAGALAYAGRHAEAVARYSEILVTENDSARRAEALYLRGESHLFLADHAAAAADFERVLALQPTHADARRHLARLRAGAAAESKRRG